MEIKQALAYGTQHINSDSIATDTQVLLCHVLNCNTAKLIAWPELALSDTQEQEFIKLIGQRQQGTPVAYLIGHREFWSLDLTVSEATLIPRPETELLVETILNQFDANQSISLADLGTGSGAIALAIASERSQWNIVATDLSQQALDIARSNANTHKLSQVTFQQGSWFEPLEKNQFDIIVSNPPYIANNDKHLMQGDVRFEPDSALASGITGMDDIEYLCKHAKDHLKPNGLFIFEHGYDQQQAVLKCLQKNNFKEIMQIKDLAGHVRVSAGKH